MRLNSTGRGLTLTLLVLVAPPAFAEVPQAIGNGAQTNVSAPAVKQSSEMQATFVPTNFDVPIMAKDPGFKIVPLGPDLVQVDYDAYMSSIEHLQTTFSRSPNWPRKTISASDAMRDMENEQARFHSRKSFAYAVLTPDGRRERGSVYVSPSPVEGYDAMVRMWVTKDEYDAGFDAKLYEWVTNWIRQDWPFAKVAYPGRSIEWNTWDSLVAASKARKAASGK